MFKKNLLFLIFLVAFIFSGCSEKVVVKALQPAQIDKINGIKKIAVLNFKNDKVGLSGKIEANLMRAKIDGKRFFQVASRKDFNKIINEQKLQSSGLVDTSQMAQVGQLTDVQALIVGRVGRVASQDTIFYESRSRCRDAKCKSVYTYQVRCIQRFTSLPAEIRIIDVTKGNIVYADNFFKKTVHRHCSDDSRILPSKWTQAQALANVMAKEFVKKLTPHYVYFEVALLEDEDIDYSDEAQKLLEVSLKYIKQSRYTKAKNLLMRLVDATSRKSYVPFYNLGVIAEIQGQYQKAQKFYKEADKLMVEPVEEINEAVIRIEKLIQNNNKAKEQLQ